MQVLAPDAHFWVNHVVKFYIAQYKTSLCVTSTPFRHETKSESVAIVRGYVVES